MTTKLEQAARQALDALEHAAWCVQENYSPDRIGHDWDEQITALREALAEQPRLDVDLTDDEILKIRHKIESTAEWSYVTFAGTVIAKYKDKNSGN